MKISTYIRAAMMTQVIADTELMICDAMLANKDNAREHWQVYIRRQAQAEKFSKQAVALADKLEREARP